MPGSRKKILIIEDDNTVRNLLSDNLNLEYEIVQAEDGEQGLSFILDFKPDLVVLDLLLPKLAGLDLLERLRKYPDPETAKTKVMVYSNFSSPEFLTKAKNFNVTDYLVKSDTTIEDLVNKVKQAFN
jgi:DNA-binding response OmpR family regulator